MVEKKKLRRMIWPSNFSSIYLGKVQEYNYNINMWETLDNNSFYTINLNESYNQYNYQLNKDNKNRDKFFENIEKYCCCLFSFNIPKLSRN